MVHNPRPYRAPQRSEQARQTRVRILTAAHLAFVERGYGATIAEIAAAAEVSTATVELVFKTKAALLGEVIDVALAGDDEPVAILDRDWVHRLDLLAAPAFLEAAALALATGGSRVVPVLSALDEGSRRTPALTALADRLSGQRGVMAAWIVDKVDARRALADGLSREDAIAVTLSLIDPRTLRRLLIEERWSTEHVGRWLGRALTCTLLDPIDPRVVTAEFKT